MQGFVKGGGTHRKVRERTLRHGGSVMVHYVSRPRLAQVGT